MLCVGILLCVAAAVFWLDLSDKPGARASLSPLTAVPENIGTLTVGELQESFPGYTLYSMCGNAQVHLLDHQGESVHQWSVDADRARLLPNGNLLVVHASKWGLTQPNWRRLRKYIREYSWGGEVVWEQKLRGPAHHDIQRLENGNTLALVMAPVPADHPARAQIKDPTLRTLGIRSDAIQEVSPDGEVVWEWRFHEHVDINSCGAEVCPSKYQDKVLEGERNFDWSHINTISVIPENRWHDQGDTRFKPGNIMVLPRNWSTILVIDKETKDTVWEYSGDYRGGLSGGHEAHMIAKGLPGAGNILVVDNGRDRKETFILEVNPQTKQLEWVYDVGENFFTRAAGSVQRLPNGNTLISEDLRGRVFEVTPDRETVWEFSRGFQGEETMTRINRARRYPIEYVAPHLG